MKRLVQNACAAFSGRLTGRFKGRATGGVTARVTAHIGSGRGSWRPWHSWGPVVSAFALALSAAGCGPGLGGTGTGLEVDAVAALGATEVSVCSADLGDLLGCAASTPLGPNTSQPTNAAVNFADPNAPADSTLELQGQQALLNLRCRGWQFTGRFAQVPGQTPRYVGHLQAGGSEVGLATLEVQRNGAGLSVTLTDAAATAPATGRVLAGPLLMQRVSTLATGGRCS